VLAILIRVPKSFDPGCGRDSIRLNIKLLGNSQTISDHLPAEGQMILANNASRSTRLNMLFAGAD
jgi:hypothetical protein